MTPLPPAATTTEQSPPEGQEGQTWTQQNPLLTFLPFLLFFVLLWYLLIGGPQRRQTREREAMLSSLRKGDKVVTVGGIHGVVVSTDTQRGLVTLRLAKGVEVDFSKSAISSIARGKEGDSEAAGEKK